MKEADVIERFADALAQCLRNVPRTSIGSVQREPRAGAEDVADLVVDLTVLGRRRTMIVDVKAAGQPRRAREAVAELKRLTATNRFRDSYPVLAAPYISDASASICRESGVGYVDLSGNCRLAFDGLYVERVAAENAYQEKRSSASFFSPKSSRILRLLLDQPRRPWQVQQLAQSADVSIGLVSRIKQQLEEREWLAPADGGFRLTDPEQVLMAWAEDYTYTRNDPVEYYTLDGLPEAESAIAAWCRESGVTYAMTGFSGARLSSPRVRYNRATVYVASSADALAANVGLKRVDSGGNVVLLKPYDDGVFQDARVLYGMTSVSPVQLYLDLSSMPGRGEEAAEEILVRELRPSWR